ncbi:MAG: cysteinyl-tRNA synthetase [Oscillochloridaceae bacterium umkhey_bin13]
MSSLPTATPGLLALIGSGETTAHAGVVYDRLAANAPTPLPIAILETPAGFQPNSAQVAGKVADYLRTRLQGMRPDVSLIAARARGSAASPDDPAISASLQQARLIFLGAGSPTYAVRQLAGSLAWQRTLARHRHGAALATASAATVAMGALALPVYEIFKVGSDLHWQPGLDLLGPYGLRLILVPHWDNAEGGAELDTSRCFVGQARFAQLLALLPPGYTVVGIDEHTDLLFDLVAGTGQVFGRGSVTVMTPDGQTRRYARQDTLALSELGPFQLPDPTADLPAEVWAWAAPAQPDPAPAPAIPPEVTNLVAARQHARAARDWPAADTIRQQLAGLGWQVRDTPEGPVLEALS